MPGHTILLGDSIFDNSSYVPGGVSVIEHLAGMLPRDCRASLRAVDGARVANVYDQLGDMPEDASHLVLSVGGNDALWIAHGLFARGVKSVQQALQELAGVVEEFRTGYQRLVGELRTYLKPLTICTIYDRVPGLGPAERAGLCVFNDIITRTAFANHATLIDLRLICSEPDDYSSLSPIEPSTQGGEKIARAIVEAVSGTTGSRVVL